MVQPSETGSNGRDNAGRFAPGNRLAKGNPFSRRMAQLRSALISAVTEDDLRGIIQALIEKAKKGDVAAAKEVLDRTLGKPQEADLIARMEELEEILATHRGRSSNGSRPAVPATAGA